MKIEKQLLVDAILSGASYKHLPSIFSVSTRVIQASMKEFGLHTSGKPGKKSKRLPNACSCGSGICNRNNKYCEKCIENRVYLRKQRIEDCKTDATRRIFLLRNTDRKCGICGITEWNGCAVPLELHHIDGNWKNNIGENLILVCPNCHALTDTYKNKNKGNGRTSRR